MSGGDNNADGNWSEKKVEADEVSVRTVECLRGRLLAERMASRNANVEADQLGNKLIELENLLKEEAKSRNRAEKKLKFLLKKLESMNITYVSDESEQSGLLDKSDASSVSSTPPSITKQPEKENENPVTEMSNKCETQEPDEKSQSSSGSTQLNQSGSENGLSEAEESFSFANEANLSSTISSQCETGTIEFDSTNVSNDSEQNVAENATSEELATEASVSTSEVHSEITSKLESNHSFTDSKADEQRATSSTREDASLVEDESQDDHIDNTLALVPVDMPDTKQQKIDPEVLDATVKEVLDALRHAREQLQSSMERRRMNMIRVG